MHLAFYELNGGKQDACEGSREGSTAEESEEGEVDFAVHICPHPKGWRSGDKKILCDAVAEKERRCLDSGTDKRSAYATVEVLYRPFWRSPCSGKGIERTVGAGVGKGRGGLGLEADFDGVERVFDKLAQHTGQRAKSNVFEGFDALILDCCLRRRRVWEVRDRVKAGSSRGLMLGNSHTYVFIVVFLSSVEVKYSDRCQETIISLHHKLG